MVAEKKLLAAQTMMQLHQYRQTTHSRTYPSVRGRIVRRQRIIPGRRVRSTVVIDRSIPSSFHTLESNNLYPDIRRLRTIDTRIGVAQVPSVILSLYLKRNSDTSEAPESETKPPRRSARVNVW